MTHQLLGVLISISLALLGALIAHTFYFGRLLGRILESLKHIEDALLKNDKEHEHLWSRIHALSDKIQH